MSIETEFKWRATAPADFDKMLSAVRTLTGRALPPVQILHISDAYADTPDEALSAQKIAMRVRCTDGAYEATLKTKTQLENGKAVRREETLPLPGAHTHREALVALRSRGTWQGVDVAQLEFKFYIQNNRRVYTLVQAGAIYELALDEVEITAGERRQNMLEIELELKAGPTEDFCVWAQKLGEISGLKAPEYSKVATATALWKGEIK